MAIEDATPERPIVSRAEARRLGLKRYFTGKPCRNGHIAERTTGDKKCVVCKKERMTDWYLRNRDQRLLLNKARYAENAPESRAYARRRYHEVMAGAPRAYSLRTLSELQCVSVLVSERRAADNDTMEARRASYGQALLLDPSLPPMTAAEARAVGSVHYFSGLPCPQGHVALRYANGGQCVTCRLFRGRSFRLRNRQKTNREHGVRWRSDPDYRARRKASIAKWKALNPTASRVVCQRRRGRLLEVGGSFTVKDVAEILKAQKSRCAYCRASLKHGYHIDHIKPLGKRGANDRRNLQLLCPPCNLRKAAKDPIDFAQEIGLLL